MAAGAAAALAFVLSLGLPVLLKPLLLRLGVLDVPNERSSHTKVAIRGAGITVAVGLLAGIAAGLPALAPNQRPILAVVAAVCAAAALLGWIEDYRGVSIAVRAALQAAIGAAGTAWLWSMTELSPLWIPIGCFAVAGYINVANFMDGINGISGLHGLAVGVFYAAAGAASDEPWLILAGAVTAAAFAAFLPWNVVRGSMFLGDVGSYALGAVLAASGVAAFLNGVHPEYLLGPVTIYLADTFFTLMRRIAAGERWYAAHRQHVYQRLTDAGLTHVQSALLVTAATVLVSVISLYGLRANGAGSAVAGLAVVLVIAAYLASPALLSGAGPAVGRRRL